MAAKESTAGALPGYCSVSGFAEDGELTPESNKCHLFKSALNLIPSLELLSLNTNVAGGVGSSHNDLPSSDETNA